MVNFDYVTKNPIKNIIQIDHKFLDHPYRILIIGGSGSEKTNSFSSQILTEFNYMLKIYMKQNITF